MEDVGVSENRYRGSQKCHDQLINHHFPYEDCHKLEKPHVRHPFIILLLTNPLNPHPMLVNPTRCWIPMTTPMKSHHLYHHHFIIISISVITLKCPVVQYIHPFMVISSFTCIYSSFVDTSPLCHTISPVITMI